MESSHKIASGTLLSLSEQQLVDCSTVNYGCNGGWPEEGFDYFMTSKSMSEASYPYTAMDGTCKYNSSATTGVYSSGNYVAITSNNTSAMKSGVAIKPLSVYIEADAAVFQSYKSGIFTSTSCGTATNHATNIVGWGTDPTYGDYWIMRNSWGTGWGESGYMRMQVAVGAGLCGIN